MGSTHAGETALTFGLLGPVEAWVDGREVPLGGPRARAVLAALLLEPNRVVPLASIVATAWGDEAPDSARFQAQNRMSALRRALREAGGEDVIETSGAGYVIHVGPSQLDAQFFDAQVVEAARRSVADGDLTAAAKTLAAALRVWRGPALHGMETPRLLAAARRLDGSRLAAREQLADLELRLGHHHEVVGELFDLVEAHPWREGAVGLQMLALYRSGRRREALETYDRTHHLLTTELGIDPGTNMQHLRDQILRDDPDLMAGPAAATEANRETVDVVASGHRGPAAAPAGDAGAGRPLVPRQLPPAVSRLVGRGSQLSAILASLEQCEAGPAVVAIHGPGGVGKSALAVSAGHQSAQMFPDGQLYVDLQGAALALAPLPVADVVGRFLRALGVPAALVPTAEPEAVSLYRSLMAHRRVLIIADNASSAEQFAALLPTTPGSALIATSRHVLGTLDGALHLDLQPLSETDANALLAHIAGRGRVEAESEATATLARTCGYLPLALRILGARLLANPQWTVAELVRRLADQRRVLQELNAVDANLRASLQLSWRELRADDNPVDALAARAFLALGAIRLPSVSLALAAALTETPPEAVELALDRLVEVRLVERDRDHFRMHDLVRLFAAELATGDPDRSERLPAALLWYRSAADQIGRLMRGTTRSTLGRPPTDPLTDVTDPPSAGVWLDGERANLVALARQALLESHTVSRLAAELVLALYPAILMRGHAYEWEVLCRLVVDAADRVQAAGLVATALTRLSVMMAIQRRVDEALECLEQGLPLYRLSGDRSGEASALETAGMVYVRVGRAEEALSYFEHALRLRSELGERYAEGITLSNAAEAYHRLGRAQEALRCLERSLEIRHEFGDLAGAAITLLNKGEVFAQLGMMTDALHTADDAIETSRKAGDRESERRSLDLRARIRIKAGDIDAALVDCESVLVLAGTSDNTTDLDDLIAALETVGQHDYAGRMRRRTASGVSFKGDLF